MNDHRTQVKPRGLSLARTGEGALPQRVIKGGRPVRWRTTVVPSCSLWLTDRSLLDDDLLDSSEPYPRNRFCTSMQMCISNMFSSQARYRQTRNAMNRLTS